MKDWLFYTQLAVLDLFRLRSSTQHHVIIITGICLPILLLMGLKQGHIAELRQELVRSPTGRQVVFWSAQGGELLDDAGVASLQETLPKVDLIIPEVQRPVYLSLPLAENAPIRISPAAKMVTLYSTRPGDPILQQAGASSPDQGELGLVLAKSVAESLEVAAGEELSLIVERTTRDGLEAATARVTVKSVVDFGGGQSSIGYAEIGLIDRLEQFIRGYQVAEFNWPPAGNAVRDRYQGYLLICERQNDLTEDDREALQERGLQVQQIKEEPLTTLHGLLDKEKVTNLNIYHLTSPRSTIDADRRLSLSPSEISQPLGCDGVVLAWNEPTIVKTAGASVTLLGCSMPRRIWLRQYLRDPDLPFDYDQQEPLARPLDSEAGTETGNITLPLGNDQDFLLPWEASLDIGPESPAPSFPPVNAAAESDGETLAVGEMLAVVPADWLARLRAFQSGLADYDSQSAKFIPRPMPPVYDKARLYARTIDDVPAVVKFLSADGYALMSEDSRIREIQGQSQSLQMLVVVVGVGVFSFGVVTVLSVLVDSTDRKRGVMGILRVMGVSRQGVFYLVVFRAMFIGLLAGVTSVAAGWGLSALLSGADGRLAGWIPSVSIVLVPTDVAIVFLGAMTCSALGALVPAWRAAKLDPFDAVVEGRFL
ncbi:MAG: ABC transporter permease [Planctomycetales bacterium]